MVVMRSGGPESCGGRSPGAPCPATPGPSLLAELAAEYPGLPGSAVARALAGATRAAGVIGGGAEATATRTALLVRDRLDVLRERATMAARRAGPPDPPEAGDDSGKAHASAAHAAAWGAPIPCTYCRAAIPARCFDFWSATGRLLTANCPACDRRTTVRTSTWLRVVEQSRMRQPSR